MSRRILGTVLMSVLVVAVGYRWLWAGQGGGRSEASLAAQALRQEPASHQDSPRLCAALRGNGNYLMTHFASLARLTEHYGRFDGLAGGSSASISIFIYESILLNPAVKACPTGDCDAQAQALRLALLLKSVKGYFLTLFETDEALAVKGLSAIAQRATDEGIGALLDVNPLAAAAKLRTLLNSQDVHDVLNPEIYEMLTDVPNLRHNVREVYTALTGIGSFSATDDAIFFRPGIIDFAGLAAKIGRVGSFYAGYGPFDLEGTRAFLDACSPHSAGVQWDAVEGRKVANTTCGALFHDLVKAYRSAFLVNEINQPNRLNDEVGAHLHALVSTSLITGEAAIARLQKAQANYNNGSSPDYRPPFEDVRFALWSSPEDRALLIQNGAIHDDLKARKRLPLGRTTWRTALSYSPAEPGLARIRMLDEQNASAGGWPDLHPVTALRDIGCEKIVYITRQGDDSAFGRGVARLLGMTSAQERALYDLDSPTSSFSLALAGADGVWCTDWDSFKDLQISEMMTDAYQAPFATKNAVFTAGLTPYPRIEATAARGCTAGAK